MNDLINGLSGVLDALVDRVFQGINQLLTRVEHDVQQLVCGEEAVLKQLEFFVGSLLEPKDCQSVHMGNPFSMFELFQYKLCCWRGQHFGYIHELYGIDEYVYMTRLL